MDVELLALLKQLLRCLTSAKTAEMSVTSNNRNNQSATLYFFFHGYHEKDVIVYQHVRGRRHNSQGLNLFFLRMLLGASLVQQRGRRLRSAPPGGS